ncbi:MAG: hypothetical protein QF752_09995, partial [Planctomycetota bacterium]|nr:hypothetical protein [Planctomycetota bacterium]
MSEAVPPPANADHQMILDAFQRGWLDRATTSAALEIFFRHRVLEESFDLPGWLEESGHLSASRIAALRSAGVTISSGYSETVQEPPVRMEGATPILPEEFQRYTDLKPLASGGMGQILLATDPEIGRQVAIKILHTERNSDRQALRRFRREVEITGRLEHPNIVPVHDAGRTADGTHFFCMKLVGG